MTLAAIIAGGAFFALVALSTVLDGIVKLKRVKADAELLAGPRYRRVDLELAVDAAVSRSAYLGGRPVLPLEHAEAVRAGVLEDLDAGNLVGLGLDR